jgi:hypothetical protein
VTRTRSLPVLDEWDDLLDRIDRDRTCQPPRTYGGCIAGTELTGTLRERLSGRKECGALACCHNLRTVRSESVPGRRRGGTAPEWTLDSEAIAASPSCALDVASVRRGIGYRCSELAEMFGRSTRRYQQEVKAALLRLETLCAEQGIEDSAIDAMRALMEEEFRCRRNSGRRGSMSKYLYRGSRLSI